MEILRGTATAVRYTVHVSGGGDNSGVSTSHHIIFKIDDKTVMFTSGFPAVISDGDRLVVAGQLKGRVLVAEAYVNQTAGVRGDSGVWANFAAMLIFLVPGMVAVVAVLFSPLIPWLADLDQLMIWLVISAGVLFCGLGFFFMYKWRRIRAAIEMLEQG